MHTLITQISYGMKAVITSLFALLLFACANNQKTLQTDTVKVVMESFYPDDKATLKKYICQFYDSTRSLWQR